MYNFRVAVYGKIKNEQRIEINTPLPLKASTSQKITTPPGSVLALKRKNVNPSNIETPLKSYDNNDFDSLNLNKNLLLSPAFSSPQNHFKTGFTNQYPYVKPTEANTYNSSPPSSNAAAQNLSSFDEEFELEKIKKKKKKKDKKAFDISSSDKPPYSYATLIGMSIMSHPDKRLTLSSIYQWISDTFKYYKKEDVGWQNSIRHNLSLNKAFIKGEKSKDGKGHFWCIELGCEDQFLKLRNNKKGSYQEIMDQIYSSQNSHSQSSHSNPHVPESRTSTRKRAIGSIPSSPNYYEANDSYNLSEAADYHRRTNFDTDEDDTIGFQNKKQKLGNRESDLGAPFDHNWNLSPQQVKGNSQSYDLMNTPKFVISESPSKPLLASKNLTFTSSFSCNSNLELSPIRPSETGPLLEPLTPGKVYKIGAINHHIPSIQYQSNTVFNSNLNSTNSSNQTQKTPSQINPSQNQPKLLQSQSGTHTRNPSNSHMGNLSSLAHLKTPKGATAKTPIRLLKTPQTNLKKLWNSPGYLDDFYYSPLITSLTALHSYDDDDMILRAFESPANNRKVASQSSIDTSKALFAEVKSTSLKSIERKDS